MNYGFQKNLRTKISMKIMLLFLFSGFIFQFLFINATKLHPLHKYLHAPLPEGIPAYTKDNSQCFTKSETQQIEAFIFSTENTIALPSCSQRFIKPLQVITDNRYYQENSGGSTFDCLKYRRHKASSMLITKALEQISSYADARLPSAIDNDLRLQDSQCLANVFYSWAKIDALSVFGIGSDSQAKFSQMWVTAGLATVYAKYPTIDSSAKKSIITTTISQSTEIKKWFTRLGERVYQQIADTDRQVQKNPASHLNKVNMAFWRAYSLLATATITQNLLHVQKSRQTFKIALAQITNSGTLGKPEDKGFLPLELERRSRALTYHDFALKPILGMVNLSRAMQCSFLKTDQDLWKIALLYRKVIEGTSRPEIFQEAAFCHINGSCEATSDLVVTREELEQTATANSEFLYVLLGNDSVAKTILQRVDSYLNAQGIQRKTSFTSYKERSLGGDVRYSPAPASISISNHFLINYCMN